MFTKTASMIKLGDELMAGRVAKITTEFDTETWQEKLTITVTRPASDILDGAMSEELVHLETDDVAMRVVHMGSGLTWTQPLEPARYDDVIEEIVQSPRLHDRVLDITNDDDPGDE